MTGLLLTEEYISTENLCVDREWQYQGESERNKAGEDVLNVHPAPEYRSTGRNQSIA